MMSRKFACEACASQTAPASLALSGILRHDDPIQFGGQSLGPELGARARGSELGAQNLELTAGTRRASPSRRRGGRSKPRQLKAGAMPSLPMPSKAAIKNGSSRSTY